MQSALEPVIHIGMPKTATKTLQWRLFSEHSQIYYLGRFDGPQFQKRYRQFDACRNAEVQELMGEIAYTNIAAPDFNRCATLAEKILEPARAEGLVPVWSWESYSTDALAKRRMRARNLRRVFGKAKILMTIRHPISLLESAFLQELKRDNVGPGGKVGRPVYFSSMDDWMRRELKREVAYHLEYAQTIKTYLELFGRDRVHVLLFEELCADSRGFFDHVCEILGVSAEEGYRLVSGARDNTRWTQDQIDALASIKGSFMKSWQFRFAKRKQRRAMLGLGPGGVPIKEGPKAHLRMSDHWRRRVVEMTKDDNQWLETVLGLPLEKYGYFES